MMMSTMLATLSCALALVGSAIAVGPLAQEVSTSTGEPRTVGTAISDGHTVYSVNWCTMYYTTACDVSISYGLPVSTPSVVVSSSGPATDFYPVPTSGGSSEQSVPSSVGSSSTESGETSSPYGGEPTGSTSDGAAPSSSAGTDVVSSGQYPSVTETGGYSTGTSTETAETGTPTAAGATVGLWQAPVLGGAALAVFFLV